VKKAFIILLVGACLFLLPAVTPVAGEEQPVDPAERVLVKIGDLELTQLEFDLEYWAALGRMNKERRPLFQNSHGRRQFLEMLVDEKIWVNGALEVGLDEDPAVIATTRMYRDKALVRMFYEKEMVDRARPSENEVRAFYDANPNRFLTAPRIKAKHILLEDSLEAEAVLFQLKAGASFEDMAKEKSVDERTAEKGGDLGLLIRGFALPEGIGGWPAFEDSLFSQNLGLSKVIKSGNGYHIVFISDKIAAKVRPFESARKNIEDGFIKERVADLRKDFYSEFSSKYPVEYLIPDSSVSPQRSTLPPEIASTPEDLFQAAMDSKDSRQRIAIYEELIKKFPDSKYASQAQFMIGFIYSEELEDYRRAQVAFRIVVEQYPESELVDSAKWMIENMRDDSQSIGTVEDVKRKAKESSKPGGK
jgi:hypothetical protein